MQLSLEAMAGALPNGRVSGNRVLHTLPGRKNRDRSCALMLVKGGTDFVVKDHHRDAWPWQAHKDFVRAAAGLPDWQPRGRDPDAIRRKRQRENAKRRALRAMRRKDSLSQRRPWEALDMSRATWYRRGRPSAVRQNLPTPTKFIRSLLETSKLRTNEPRRTEPTNKRTSELGTPELGMPARASAKIALLRTGGALESRMRSSPPKGPRSVDARHAIAVYRSGDATRYAYATLVKEDGTEVRGAARKRQSPRTALTGQSPRQAYGECATSASVMLRGFGSFVALTDHGRPPPGISAALKKGTVGLRFVCTGALQPENLLD